MFWKIFLPFHRLPVHFMLLCRSFLVLYSSAAAAKSLQSCPTLCDPIDGSPPGSPVPGILQAGTLEWFAISFSNAWKWKVKVKSLSLVRLHVTPWTAAYQAPPSMGFSRQEYWSGLHCLLRYIALLADIAVYTFGIIPKNSLPKLIQGKFPLCCLPGVLIHFELILCVVFNSGPVYSSCGYWVSISLESILS